MDCSPPGSSVHGISQARILEWVAISSSRGSSWPGDRTHLFCVSCIPGGFFTAWVIREAHFVSLEEENILNKSCKETHGSLGNVLLGSVTCTWIQSNDRIKKSTLEGAGHPSGLPITYPFLIPQWNSLFSKSTEHFIRMAYNRPLWDLFRQQIGDYVFKFQKACPTQDVKRSSWN